MSAALPPGAWIRPGSSTGFRPDAVVLDIDGVLIDVRASFREAVRETVVIVQRLLGATQPWRPAQEDIVALKAAGGFNDDIDVSIALIALGLAGRVADLAAVCAAVDAAGGGLRALRRVAPELRRIDGALVLEVFDELYWGPVDSERRSGSPSRHVPPGPGLIDREGVLVEPDLPGRLRAAGVRSVAIVSGRTPRELESALGKLGWTRDALDAVVTGDEVRKPDPACLDRVVAATGAARLVYVGDVRDDWELVRRHRAERDGGVEARGVLVGAMAEVTSLRALGVDATVERTEDLFAVLDAWAGAVPPQLPTGGR